ncbi:hypothetical protein R5H32_09060 [Defluviimonas sp. D31]|uniref:bestrophin-like domain n=1 Tax=Defluviimonas sp. D31 TaxID=3083253 RepID=UPI00296FE42C|nr:hypothetical protein [Defluviimonas sp. D31]MDW4549498.1 hypothetical protein [Defluviimonas sp. D31]
MDPTTSAAVYGDITVPLVPFPILVIILLIALPLSAILGSVVGAARRRQAGSGQDVDKAVDDTTLGAILALLGLLLAFTFGNALSLTETRKSDGIAEAAALGTVFLRADYLPEPSRTKIQAALLGYAKTRVLPADGGFKTRDQARQFIDVSLVAQARLWPLTLEATADPMPAPLKTFFASAMNDALDAHLRRMQTLSSPVSGATQLTLLATALTALFLLGDRSGAAGRKPSWRTFVLSGFLFVVMVMIADTQNAFSGLIRLDDSTLDATIFEMEQALEGRV